LTKEKEKALEEELEGVKVKEAANKTEIDSLKEVIEKLREENGTLTDKVTSQEHIIKLIKE